jgi:hypothetical protein
MGIFGKKPQRTKQSVELGSDLFKRIEVLLSTHWQEEDSEGIAYFTSAKSEKQILDVVGESFCQDEIKSNFKLDKWVYGLLVPEQSNKSDPNAVAIYLITKDFGVCRVGYLKQEMAKKVSQKIANLMVNDGKVIPVLATAKSGPSDSSNWGIRAYAMTDVIQF